ncbi:MAG: hemolysin III family protein [Acidimicrobiales bacterium]
MTSAGYYLFARSPQARRLMQRADHSMIFLLIAGTFTPVCILALAGPWRWLLLAAVWAGAVAGIAIKIFALDRLPRLGNGLYIVLGWAGMAALPTLIHRPGLLALIIVAGLLYTGGAVLFLMKRPRLSPNWFGYHEVWHSFGIAAGILLYVANFGLIRAG